MVVVIFWNVEEICSSDGRNRFADKRLNRTWLKTLKEREREREGGGGGRGWRGLNWRKEKGFVRVGRERQIDRQSLFVLLRTDLRPCV